MTEQIWQKSEGEKLKNLRNAANVSAVDMARWAAISINQLRQLEEGGDSSFYSQQIKYNMGCKLLKLFGDSPSELEIGSQKHHASSLELLDRVIDINERDLEPDTSTKWSATIHNFWSHYKVALILFILVAISISLDVYYKTFENDAKVKHPPKTIISSQKDFENNMPTPAKVPLSVESVAAETSSPLPTSFEEKKAP